MQTLPGPFVQMQVFLRCLLALLTQHLAIAVPRYTRQAEFPLRCERHTQRQEELTDQFDYVLQVPLQFNSALLLILSASWAEKKLQQANVSAVTALFFLLVLLAATQDIAVDGWALTLLSKKHVG